MCHAFARAAIFKFIDNIMALYSHVAAMMLVVLCSVMFLGFTLTTTFVCGFAVCIISLFLYHHNPTPEQPSGVSALQELDPPTPSDFKAGPALRPTVV